MAMFSLTCCPMTSQTYYGAEIHCTWPSASLWPGAAKPSYEKWEAWLPSGERLADFTLREIKAQIKEVMA
jgi:hypothetical protein